jgi:hypothetical protein
LPQAAWRGRRQTRRLRRSPRAFHACRGRCGRRNPGGASTSGGTAPPLADGGQIPPPVLIRFQPQTQTLASPICSWCSLSRSVLVAVVPPWARTRPWQSAREPPPALARMAPRRGLRRYGCTTLSLPESIWPKPSSAFHLAISVS